MNKPEKKNYLLIVVITLDLIITMLCQALGCLMYTSNAKSVLQNLTYVEMTDLISNIEYGLHFGKSIESYYGMESLLGQAASAAGNVDELYIVNQDGDVLFKTGDSMPYKEALNLDVGSNIKHGKTLYCSFQVTDDVALITQKDISDKIKDWNNYYLFQALVALNGFLISSGIMVLIWMFSKSGFKAYRIIIVFLIIWILIMSSFIGFSTYGEYNKSLVKMCDSIDQAVQNDFYRMYAKGIDDEYISGVDEYLMRYADNIPEIQSVKMISLEDGCEFELSRSYLRKVNLDYIIQTLLFLAFSGMILTEYQLFMSGIGIKETEEADHEEY